MVAMIFLDLKVQLIGRNEWPASARIVGIGNVGVKGFLIFYYPCPSGQMDQAVLETR
jgi:hypothetical protein